MNEQKNEQQKNEQQNPTNQKKKLIITNTLQKCVSFDVGVKNFAYIIFTLNTSIRTGRPIINIFDWKRVDIVDDIQNIFCATENCKKLAKFINFNTNSPVPFPYCSQHRQKDWKRISNNTKKCIFCKNKMVFHYKFPNDLHPQIIIGSCKAHKKLFLSELNKLSTGNISIQKYSCVKKINREKLVKSLIKILEENKELAECKYVCIESQPITTNPLMRLLGDILYGYFTLKQMQKNINGNVMFCGSINKLKPEFLNKILPCSVIDKIHTKHLKNKHAENKVISKLVCEEFIKYNPDYCAMYFKHKKTDDIADCLLQGLFYINNIK